MNYRPEVDGLRAVAVIPVILFHAGLPQFSGGYVGVDVFFVISGYLITMIITRELIEERFSLLRFYERRARRILPALFLVMGVCLPFAWLLLYPGQMKDFGQNIFATSLFSSNILLWLKNSYFSPAAEMNPLLHTWSLAVEEQYYVLFPLLLMLLWRWGKPALPVVLVALLAVSLLGSAWAATSAAKAGFYLIHFRGWELLLGSMCAFLAPRLRARSGIDDMFGAAGLALILVAVFTFDTKTPFPGLLALVPTMGAVLVILFSREESLVGRLLGGKCLVPIGLLSYSAYLWHQPAFAFYRHYHLGNPAPEIMLLIGLLSLALAWLSWRLVERPFRNPRRFSRRFVFSASALLIVTFAGFGFYLHVKDGALPGDYERPGLEAFRPDNRALQEESWRLLRQRTGDPGYSVDHNAADRRFWFDAGDPRDPVLVVGDSHAKDIYNLLFYSEDFSERFQLARFGAQVKNLNDRSHGLYTSKNYRHADLVVVAALYGSEDLAALADVVEALKSDGKRVVLVGNIFEFQQFGDRTLADVMLLRAYREGNLPPDDAKMVERINAEHFERYLRGNGKRPEIAEINRTIREIAEAESVTYKDRMQYVCSRREEACHVLDEGYRKHFYDYSHHTLAGARFFAGRVDRIGWTRDF